MFGNVSGFVTLSQKFMQKLSVAFLVLLALGLVGLSLAAAFGFMSWPELAISYAGAPLENAGMIAQLGLTALAVGLLFFLPGNARMMKLEHSHRDFQVRMDDVARAYRAAHEDDRKQLFRIGSEFDSVRERMLHLRDHPDLGALEPELLELAAQMSYEAKDLAKVYSVEKVDRARLFLRQRQEEVDTLDETLALAKNSIEELRHWMLQIETEEGVVAKQISILEKDLFELLPKLGYDIGVEESPAKKSTEIGEEKVVPLANRPAGSRREKSKIH